MRQQGFDQVEIARKPVKKIPRITPNYIMRNLASLPAFYGTLELPSIDNLFFYRFKARDYSFSGFSEPEQARAENTGSGNRKTDAANEFDSKTASCEASH
jgi:hypothetical protein